MWKTLKYKKPALLVLVLLSWFSASSQQPADSLMHYLEIAAKNNPGVIQKFTEYQAALHKIPQVGSLPDPELSVGVFLKPMELMQGYQVSDIRLMQMFPWFGVLKNAKDEMSLMAKAKYESFRDAKLILFYDVHRTWYELIKIQQDILISEKNLEILKAVERLTLVRFKSPLSEGGGSSSGSVVSYRASQSSSAGSPSMQTMGSNTGNNSGTTSIQGSSSMIENSMGSQSGSSGLADLYRIKIETGDLENSIASLKNMKSTISARFNTYLNRRVVTSVSLPDTLKPETFDFSLSVITDSILAKNPMLGMLKYENQSFDARYRMVTNMGYPMVGLGVNYSIISKLPYITTMNGKDMIMPMITVTLPVYRKKYKAMKSEVELLKTASEQGYFATSNSLQAELYEAVQLYQDARRRQKLYADQFQLADKSLTIMIKTFSSSGAGLTDILRVRQQTLDYEFKQVEAVADYNRAVALLKRLMANYQIQ